MKEKPPTPKEFLGRICRIQGFEGILSGKGIPHEEANADYAACFREYREYVLDELRVDAVHRTYPLESIQDYLLHHVAKQDIEESHRRHLVLSMKNNPPFLADLRRQAPQVYERFVRDTAAGYQNLDSKFSLGLITGFYFPWQTTELARVHVQIASLNKAGLFQLEKHKQTEAEYRGLLTNPSSPFATAKKAGLDRQSDMSSASLKKAQEDALKSAEDAFAAVRDKHVALHDRTMQSLKDETRAEHDRARRIGDKIKILEAVQEEVRGLGNELYNAKEKLKSLEEERDKLVQEKARLEAQQADLLRKEAEKARKQQGDALGAKSLRERDIESAMKPAMDRIKIITGRKLAPLPEKIRLAAERVRVAAEEVASISANHDAALKRLHTAEAEALAINEMYNVVRSAEKEAIHDEEKLSKLHAAAEAELKWLRSLGKNDKALNVYSTATNVSYDFFLGIGNIVAGKGCGPLGNTKVGKLVTAGASLVSEPLNCLCGVGADVETLGHIYDYDTGELSISLKLGLTWGVELEEAHVEADVGLALVYEAAIVVEDDRRFRTVHTLDLVATAGFEIPVIFSAELEADLIKHKSVMDFTDVHHWAGWLSMRFAHAWATVHRSALYEDDNEFLQPSLVDVDHLEARAKATPNQDAKTQKMVRQVIPYLKEPIIRTESTEVLAGYEAAASMGVLGAGFGVEKWADPGYRKRRWDEQAREEVEVTKEGREGSVSIQISSVLNCEIDLSNTVEHSNPDMKGESITITLTPPSVVSSPLRLVNEYVDGSISSWIEDILTPSIPAVACTKRTMPFVEILNTVDKKVTWTNILQVLASSAFGPIQVCLFNSRVGARNKWVLLYWRRIFNPVNINVSHAFPVGYGLNIVPGVSLTLQRTYRERIGTNTIAYLPMIYNGLMNPYRSSDSGNPRPAHAYGREIWKAWAAAQRDLLWKLMYNISLGGWVADELRESCDKGKELVADLSYLREKADPNRTIGTVDIEYMQAFSWLEQYLSHCLKNEPSKSDVWRPMEAKGKQEIRWSLNPYRSYKEYLRHTSTQYRLEKDVEASEKALGHDMNLPHQVWDNVKWESDADVKQCRICKVTFGVMTRKHHCRRCGRIICANCSKHQLPVRDKQGKKELVRVCDDCFRRVTEKEYNPRHYAFGAGRVEASCSAMKGIPEGFHRIDIVHDGNCLFRSIAQVKDRERGQEAHHAYREKAVKHIRENLSYFQKRDPSIDHSYLNTMAGDATSDANWPRWGGGAELHALSRVINRRIILHIPGQVEYVDFAEETDRRFTPEIYSQSIHLYWEDRKGHYTLLQLGLAPSRDSVSSSAVSDLSPPPQPSLPASPSKAASLLQQSGIPASPSKAASLLQQSGLPAFPEKPASPPPPDSAEMPKAAVSGVPSRSGARGEAQPLDELAAMQHDIWWGSAIVQPVPGAREIEEYERYAMTDAVAQQEAFKKRVQTASSSPRPVSTTSEKRDPLVGRELTELFQMKEATGDGNCLFRAVALALGDSQEKHLAYRRRAMEYLYYHRKEERFSRMHQTNFLSYLYSMSQAARRFDDRPRWGGEPEIVALSGALQRKIKIYCYNFEEIVQGVGKESDYSDNWTSEVHHTVNYVWTIDMEEGRSASLPKSTALCIAYRGGNHYEGLKQRVL